MHQPIMFSYSSFIQSYHRRITSALVALLVLCACTDKAVGVSPGIAGTYLLQTAAGQPAPAVIHADIDITTGQPLEIRVVGDTLDLFSNGHYIQRARIEAYIGGQLASRSRWADNGVYTVTGSAVHFESDYLQNVAFDGSIGSIEPVKSITVTQNLAGEGTPDEYVFKNAQ